MVALYIITGIFLLFNFVKSMGEGLGEFSLASESDELMEYKEHLGQGFLCMVNVIGIILAIALIVVLCFSK